MLNIILVLLIAIGFFIWYGPWVIAIVTLWLTRDLVVYLFGSSFGERAEMTAVVFWRLVVPVVLFLLLVPLVISELAQPNRYLHWIIYMPISLTTGVALVYHYHKLYDKIQPNHYSWPKFVAAEIKLRFYWKLTQL